MTMTERHTTMTEWEQRFLQALPTLFSLSITLCLPYVARRTLAFWRATQAYERQPLNVASVQEKTKKNKFVATLVSLWPLYLELFIFGTAGYDWHKKSPLIDVVRRSIPFAILFVAFTFTSFAHFGSRFLGTFAQRASRSLNVIKGKPANVHLDYINTRPVSKSRLAAAFIVCGLLPAAVCTYVCAYGSQPMAVTLIALNGAPWVKVMLYQPIVWSAKKTSMRTHTYMITFLFIWTSLVLALVMGVVFACIYISNHVDWFKSEVKKTTSTSKGDAVGFAALDRDVVSSQLFAIFYTWSWIVHVFLPASLLCLLYRFDVSKAGWTSVTDEQATQAIFVSEEHAKQAHALKEVKAGATHRDQLGRVPILLDALPLQLPSHNGGSPATPMFKAAWHALIFVQLIGLAVNFLLPAEVELASFPRFAAELPSFGLPVSAAIYAFLAYPIILFLVVPLTSCWVSWKQGHSVTTGLRQLWKYEEHWGCNETQVTTSSQQDQEDVEKDDK